MIHSEKNSKIISDYLTTLDNDAICLHPADTIPGLTYNPRSQTARQKLNQIKGRQENKPISGLVSSLESAAKYWKKIPAQWEHVIQSLWPGPITFVWKASESAPKTMLSPDKGIGLRCPLWPPELMWMNQILDHLSYPLPTTSVNISGEEPITSWDEAVEFCQKYNIFYPAKINPKFLLEPSTVVQIFNHSKGKILRQGALGKETLISILKSNHIELETNQS